MNKRLWSHGAPSTTVRGRPDHTENRSNVDGPWSAEHLLRLHALLLSYEKFASSDEAKREVVKLRRRAPDRRVHFSNHPRVCNGQCNSAGV